MRFSFYFLLLLLYWAPLQLSATTYYLSSSLGNNNYDGKSTAFPWRTIAKINSVALQPGDSVCFKRGDLFRGHLVVNGSGTLADPILITAYGAGAQPIITGEVGASGGGDYQEAILVENQDYIWFEDLEIQNERKVSRTNIDDVDAYGLHIHNSGNRILRGFQLRNLTVRNVFAVQEMNDPAAFNGLEVAGVRIASDWNWQAGSEKNIQDVLMEDCYFTRIQRLGVHVKHAGGNATIGNDSIHRNMNLVFRNNEFHYLGGTCILPSRTYNCLIENNLFNHPGSDIDPRMPGRGSAVWTWRCINTIIQRNQCLHIRGYLDSHGIHIDHENVNTFVQYNYMEDCEGGFVEILGGNLNAVYRFNISVNDGWRNNPNWVNSNHTLWINEKAPGNNVHYCDSTYIYNNTIFMDSAYSTAIDMDARSTYIYNNIFANYESGTIGGKRMSIRNNGAEFLISHNLFYGNVVNSFTNRDTHAVFANPAFINPGGLNPYAYQLLAGSAAIDQGLAKRGPVFPEAGKGVFADVPPYPTTDFFGNPVDMAGGTPNIGACNAKNGETVTSVSQNALLPEKNCIVYPNYASSTLFISIPSASRSAITVSIVDVNGKVLQKTDNLKPHAQNVYQLQILRSIPEGTYFVLIQSEQGSCNKAVVIDRS
jgi:hypothetical protein